MKTLRLTLAAAAAALLLAPAIGLAQAKPASADGLSAQERDMLAAAQDVARRCGEILEHWIDTKEISQDRLFAGLYYPQPNTDPPKFTTDWDKLSDRDVGPVLEAALGRSATIDSVVMVDRNGYLPTHNARYSKPLTGNLAVDLVSNRTKRLFNDRIGLLAARNQAPFLFQRYQRDNGEAFMNLAVPVYVRGQHWGAVRVSYRPVEGR